MLFTHLFIALHPETKHHPGVLLVFSERHQDALYIYAVNADVTPINCFFVTLRDGNLQHYKKMDENKASKTIKQANETARNVKTLTPNKPTITISIITSFSRDPQGTPTKITAKTVQA